MKELSESDAIEILDAIDAQIKIHLKRIPYFKDKQKEENEIDALEELKNQICEIFHDQEFRKDFMEEFFKRVKNCNYIPKK